MNTTSDPRWPRGTTGLRALVECDDPAVQDGLVRVLHEQGYAVATCAGPRSRGSSQCPLVVEGACGLVEGADVVVHALDASDPAHREVLAEVSRRAPGAAVVAEAPPSAAAATADAGCEWVRYPITRGGLVDALERAAHR